MNYVTLANERKLRDRGQKETFEEAIAHLLLFDVQRFIPGMHFPYNEVREEGNVFVYKAGDGIERIFHTSRMELDNIHRNHFFIETNKSQQGIGIRNLLHNIAQQQGYHDVDPQRRIMRARTQTIYSSLF